MYVFVCVCMYVCMYVCVCLYEDGVTGVKYELSMPRALLTSSLYMYVFVCVCMYVCVYVCMCMSL